MSLRVWLPLTGDLHNQGISNPTINSNSLTIDANGKIGECYRFTSSNNSNITLTPALWDNDIDEMSFCCWVKMASFSAATLFCNRSETASTGFAAWIMSASQLYFDTGERWTINLSTGLSFTANQWYHICFTYSKSKNIKAVYINGQRTAATAGTAPTKATTTATYIGTTQTGTGNPLNGWMNDIRLYDHCLSSAEVSEIARGLILHYKLDNNGQGGRNLVSHSIDISGWSVGSGWTKLEENGSTIYHYERTGATSNTWDRLIPNLHLNPDDYPNGITVSLDFKCDDMSALNHKTIGALQIYREDNTRVGWYETQWNLNNCVSGQWQRISRTYTQAQLKTNNNSSYPNAIIAYTTVSFQLVQNGSIYIKHIKIEDGNTATAYSLAPEDYGDDNNIIEDSSGYNHNGEILNGPLSLAFDTPRYNISTHFSATNQKIKISNFPTSGFGDSYTFAWWAKISSVTPMHWGFADGIRLNGMYTGRLWNTGDGSNNPLYNPGTTTQVTAPTVNVWHHWTMTGDGTKCRVYQDGELWGEAKTYKAISGTTIYINGWNTSTDYSSNNYSISDFRIYCTALLDTDIKQLYNVGMKMDKLGNIHTGTINEKDNSITSFKRTAIVKSTALFEQKDDITQVKIGKSQIPIINVATYGSGNTPSGAFIRATKDGATSEGSLTQNLLSYKGKNIKFSYNVTAVGPRTEANFGLQIVVVQVTPPSSPQGTPTINQTLLCTEGLPYSGPLARLEQYCKLPANASVIQTVVVASARPAQNNDKTWEISNLQVEEVSTLGTFTIVPITEELELTEQPVDWITANTFIEF